MVMKKLVVIAYDIEKDRRRNKVSKLLEEIGTRKNYSVFECFISTHKLNEIQEIIVKIINKKTDTVLYYEICRACAEKITYQGIIKQDFSVAIVV